jgi:hypothetical protein
MIRIILIVGGIVIVLGAFAAVYQHGVEAERAATLAKGIALVKERDKLNVQVRTATDRDICARLGGRWLPDTNECG